MTAQLVATASRNPVKFGPGNYDELVVSTLGSADERTLWGLLRPAGQLWERVAERECIPTDYAPTAGRIKRQRIRKAADGERLGAWTFSLITGPSLGGFSERSVGGVIRAGERVK